ncbi:MAG TPA: ABC transporter permease [Candidatus Krumholzibacteria bacterium]|nr:ABC transporter permease [Candidatus Krumholzibacteria bacterium]
MKRTASGGGGKRALLGRSVSRVSVMGIVALCASVLLLVIRWDVWRELSALERTLTAGLVLLLIAAVVAGAGGQRKAASWRVRFDANPFAVGALAVLIAMVWMAVMAPLLVGVGPTELTSPSLTRYARPDLVHPMGTDRFGRDVWARVVYGGRASFGVCGLSVVLAALLGVVVGGVAGSAPRRVDDMLMRVVDGMLSFPRLLLLLAAVAFLPPGPVVLATIIAATSWMGVARIVRAEVRRMRGREFVEAAVAAGVGRARIVIHHILPNVMGHVVVAATLGAGTVILMESSLSFLGLGVQPPTPSWGSIVFEGRDALATAWWVSAFPALAITLAVISLNVIGDGIRDALDARIPSKR